jgi:hypothetical protein
MSHYIFTTTTKISRAAAKRIQTRIKAIDASAEFAGPMAIPGSRTTGWIERPNDGTNDYIEVRERNRKMADIAREELKLND